MATTAEQTENNLSQQPEKPSNSAKATELASLKGLSVRQKIYFGFSGLILLIAINMGYTLYKLNDAKQIGYTAIEQRQPAANLFQHLSGDLHEATALLSNYLLTGQKNQKQAFKVTTGDITEDLEKARELDLVKSGDISQENLDHSEELFQKFLATSNKLLELQDNNEKNAGLVLAQNTLNGPAQRFLNTINLLLTTEDFDLSNSKALKAYTTLQALRYNWVRMMSNMRLYIVSQGGGFMPDFRNFYEQTGVLLKTLTNLDYDIGGFGELDELVQDRKEYMNHLPAVIDIFKSGKYQSDAILIKNELLPTLERLRQILESTTDKLLKEAIQGGQDLTTAQESISTSAIVSTIIVLWIGILLALRISGDTVPPIRNIMTAARQISDGDLNAEVHVTSNDEIGLLGRSFNTMVYNLREAKLKEYQLIDELKALNEVLESRVEKRTKELVLSETKTRAVLDNIGEGILVLDENGNIDSLNPAAEKIFNTTEKDSVGTSAFRFLGFNAAKEPANNQAVENKTGTQPGLLGNTSSQPVEHEAHRADGSTFPMEYVVSLMKLGEKNMYVCIMRDITVRKETEATLAEAQHQLVDAAHKSGMADMATGVLHNIGNILNSVNLAGEEIFRITAGSKISGLMKANEMLEDQGENMSQFLANDEKGKKLPAYYLKMGKVLEGEITGIREEAKSLIEKTTMMKEVISTQQAYAHSGFHNEKLSIEELVEDALKIQISSLQKWGVKLEKKYGEVPMCVGQKSKLLQVITNLIKNAKEAMSENDNFNKPKELSIETGTLQDEFAFVKVTDNGCGIDAQKLAKIFSHGFTTKEGGHGFGLHTSANAMTEMHGSLKVDSEGVEKGASFTITVPLYKKAA
jgi:PAS domain S-box-containing protein